MAAPNDPIGANARSPFAGCVILILALLVMVFLVVFSTWGLFRQFNEIEKFTGTRPQPVPVAKLEGNEAAINALAEKLEKFRQDLTGDTEARLTLAADEINLAIAAYEPLKELRETFHVTAIEDGALKIAISFRMNGKPRMARSDEPGLTASDPRYLVGTMTATPRLLGREIVLEISSIHVPGASVPREFIGQMSPYRITERYQTHKTIGPAMAKLTSVTTSGGAMILARNPGETPSDRITDSQVRSASGRFFAALGVGASLFLLFVGVIVFIGLRAKAKRA